VGVDLQGNQLAGIRKHGYEMLVTADVERLPFRECFDVVVAGELVEHLYNVGLFLRSAWLALRQGGELLISTPNCWSLSRVLYVAVGTREVTHPEHTCYYSCQTLRYVLEQHGFDVEITGLPEPSRSRVLSEVYRLVALKRPIMSQTIFAVGRKLGR